MSGVQGHPIVPGRPYLARVVALPGAAGLLGLLVGDRLLQVEPPAEQPVPLVLGDLVRIVLAAPDALRSLERVGGPLHAPTDGAWQETGDALRWRQPGRQPSRLQFLAWRHQVFRNLRGLLDAQGFLEVDTPALVPAPSPEPQFRPMAAEDGFLITSPEFQLKRLLVGGCERIYRLGAVYRGHESGVHHNPEFTMLEWYRVDAGVDALQRDVEAMLAAQAAVLFEAAARHEGAATTRLRELAGALAHTPYRSATMAELFAEYLGLDLRGVTTTPALVAAAREAGVADVQALPPAFDDAFFALWERIETRLPPAPLFVTEWPAPLASLARLKPDDPTVAERVELYAGGLELANGFVELTDAAEQRRRFAVDLAARQVRGLPPLPLDERFLGALGEGMPPAAGMALGVERLVMLVTGAAEIRQVLPFARDEL